MAKRKSSAGSRARAGAVSNSNKAFGVRAIGAAAGGAALVGGALSLNPVAIGGGVAALAATKKVGDHYEGKARDGRNRGAALDYAAKRGKGGKAGDLVRAPVTVTRGNTTFTQMRMVRRGK